MPGQQGVIQEFVSDKALAGLDAAIEKLTTANSELMDTVEAADKLNSTLAQSNGLKSYNGNLDKQRVAQQKLQQQIINTQKAQLSLDQAQQKAVQSAQRQIDSQDKAAKKAQQANTEYAKLIQRQKDLNNAAQQAGAAFGTASKEYQDAAERANKVNAEVAGINQGLGNFRDQVGNYGGAVVKALGGAYGAIRQIAYILPGLGIAGAIGFLAEPFIQLFKAFTGGLSALEAYNKVNRDANDLFAEQYTKVSLLTKELTASGTEYVRQGQIIEELNKISPIYFGNLKSQDDILTKLPADLAAYNRALMLTSRIQAEGSLIAEQYKKQLQFQADLFENDQIQKNATRSIGDFARSIGELFKLRGGDFAKTGIKQTQEAIGFLTNQLLSDQKKLQDNGGDIAGDQQKIQERQVSNFLELQKIQLQTQIDYQNKIAQNEQKSYSERERALKTSYAAQIELQKLATAQELDDQTLAKDQISVINAKGDAEVLKLRTELTEKLRDLSNQELKDIRDKYSKIIAAARGSEQDIESDSKVGFEKRLQAVRDYQVKALKAAKDEYGAEIKLAGDNNQKKVAAQANYAKTVHDINKQVNDDSAKLQAEALKDLETLVKTLQTQSETDLKNSLAAKEQELADSTVNQTYILSQQYKNQEINEKQYRDGVKKINDDADLARLEAEKATAEAILAIRQNLRDALTIGGAGFLAPSDKDIQDAKAQLDKANLALTGKKTTANVDQGTASRDKLEQYKKDVAQAIQYAQQLQQAAIDIINAGYQSQIDLLEQRKQLIQTTADDEIAAVNRTLDSETNKQKKIDIINAQAKDKQAAIDKQERELKRKQAIADKEANAISIIENTAVAIMKTYGQGGFFGGTFGAIALAAIGAAQLATVLAQPIPEYFTGTDYHPGGAAIVGDRYGKELAVLPNGKLWETPDVATLVNLPTGTEIINNKEYMRMLAKPEPLAVQIQQRDNSDMVRATERTADRIVGALNKRQRVHAPVKNEKWNKLYNGMKK